jgi:uncharacterized protein (TIGR03435 family)
MARAVLVPLLAACARLAFGQTAEPAVAFEVASVKPAPEGTGLGFRGGFTGGPGARDPGRWTANNMSLASLVIIAYGLKRYEYAGPSWLDTARFNIEAKVPEGATRDQLKMMLQNLLVERFKLNFHREKREMQVFELQVAKTGPKLKQSAETSQAEGAGPAEPAGLPSDPSKVKLDKDGFPELHPGVVPRLIMMNGRARAHDTRQTTQQIAAMISNQVGRLVTDATGLQGKYDYTLTWVTTSNSVSPLNPGAPAIASALAAGGGAPAASLSDPDSGPTIFVALQEQLGLKLEPKKGTVDVLVVDRIEKTPTEN